jgi:thymidylate synthase (FAD)
MTRHRIASFSVESTRYANYAKDKFGNEITVIEPVDLAITKDGPFTAEQNRLRRIWESAMSSCERDYLDMIRDGAAPQLARSVLPNSLKTEIVMTANFREWRRVFYLRTDKAAHPQMRALMLDAQRQMAGSIQFAPVDCVSGCVPRVVCYN